MGRRSGDEFLLFLVAPDSEDAEQGRAHIRRQQARLFVDLDTHPFVFPDGTRQRIGISAGLAWYEPGLAYTSLLDKADKAMYGVKNQARGGFGEA